MDPSREREELRVRVARREGPLVPQESFGGARAQERGPGLAFAYLGDLQLRLVFESADGQLAVAQQDDLARLRLSDQGAIALSVLNMKRRLGPPRVAAHGGGVYLLQLAEPDAVPALLLERGFWRAQLQKFPQGILAAVPRRGVLMFVPAGDPGAEAQLLEQATALAAKAGDAALSRCLFLFSQSGWSVRSQLPIPVAVPTADVDDVEEGGAAAEVADDIDLDKVARGQRMLVHCVIAGFLLNAYERSNGPLPFAVLLALSAVVTVYALLGVVRLGTGLGKRNGTTIFFMVLTFVPLANIVSWIVLSVQATRQLRAGGWEVGLLGARA